MFRKLLLPVDLSDRHAAALQVAADLAGPSGEVTLLHVVELIPGLPQEEERGFYDRLERAAVKHLDRLGTALTQRGVPWRQVVVLGNRAPDLVRHARESGADLIVLTAPPFDPAHPAAGWGSLSHKVGLLAPCPVLLVK
jgi:nucleotide-binding universal stress UspA family protein